MIYIGVDVGLFGGCAVLTPDGPHVYDTPIITDGTKHQYNIPEMVALLRPFAGEAYAAVEAVHSMPKQGIASAFGFGRGLGLWEGILTALNIRFDKIPPQRWQKVMLDGMPRDKSSSILRAQQLFPSVALTRKKDHVRSDALLLAEYLKRQYGGAA